MSFALTLKTNPSVILVNREGLKENVTQQAVGICHRHRQTQQLGLTRPSGEGGGRGLGRGTEKRKDMEQVEVWQERGIFGTQISIH